MGKYETRKKYNFRTQKRTRKLKGGSARGPDIGNEFPHIILTLGNHQFWYLPNQPPIPPKPQPGQDIPTTLEKNLNTRFEFLRPEISKYFSAEKQREIADLADSADIKGYIEDSKSSIEAIDTYMGESTNIISNTYITFLEVMGCCDKTIPKFCKVPEKQ